MIHIEQQTSNKHYEQAIKTSARIRSRDLTVHETDKSGFKRRLLANEQN